MINTILLGAFVGFLGVLLAVETYTVKTGLPTISARMQALGRSAPLVIVVVCTVIGMLLVHFFG